MKFSYPIKKPLITKPGQTNPLFNNEGVWSGKTVDWSGDSTVVSLDPSDISALQRKHGTKNVNLQRATQVKRMMIDGHKQCRIIQALRGRGRGYGERMIKADHAALSSPIRKARERVQ